MGKSNEISNNERLYVIEGLKNGLRLNGRRLDEMREPQIIIPKEEYGFVEVGFGKTRLAVRVSCEITKPFEDRPFEGIFTISTELSPMASPSFEVGRNTDDEVLASRIIEKALRRSNSLDLENLCIIAGEKVWHIRADVNVLNYDGGFIDASCIGVMTALQHFKKPDVTIKGTDVIVHDFNERQLVPLSILHVPICVTYSFFNQGDKIENIKGETKSEISIMDADLTEEAVRDGFLVLTLNKNRELIQASKNGGLPIDGVTLLDLTQKAYTFVEEMTEKIKKVIQDDEKEKYKRLNLQLLETGASR